MDYYSSEQKLSYNIIKRSQIDLVDCIGLQATMTSPKQNEASSLSQIKHTKENKVHKKPVTGTQPKQKNVKNKDLSKTKIFRELRAFKGNNNDDDTNDIEEGVDDIMTPIVTREPKTISRFFLKSNSNKMKSLKAKAKPSSRVYNVKL